MNLEPTVFVVDDDPGALKSVCWLAESVQLRAEGFESAEVFLRAYDPGRPGCLVLDIRMPHMNGLQLQDELVSRGCDLPIIVVTGHGDVPDCAQAFKAGAFDFLQKPADGRILLERIRLALEHDAERRRKRAGNPEIAERLESLTSRERHVLKFLIQGFSLKRLAVELGIDVRTVAKHRARILEKMGVHNDVALTRLFLDENSTKS